MKSIIRVFSYLRHYPWLAVAQLFCALGMTVAVLVFPEVTAHLVGVIIPQRRFAEFVPWVMLALAGFFVREALNFLRYRINVAFEQRVVFDIRSDLYAKLQRLPVPWFDSRRTGDLMTRVIEDVTNMERVLIDGVELGLVATLQILCVGIALYRTNLPVALWATLPVPLLVLGAWWYSKDARVRYRAQRDAASDLNALLHDNLSGIRQIKAYVAEPDEHRRFDAYSNALRQTTLRVMKWWALYAPGMSFIGMSGYVLVLASGGREVMNNTMEPHELLKFFLYLSLFYEPAGRLHSLNQLVLSARASADRVFEILDTADEAHCSAGNDLPRPVHGHLRFDRVSFSYAEQETLHEITLEAKPGQMIALVGATGAGKSTVVNLIARFYEYNGGSLTLDGQELNTLRKSSLRDAISYVSQDPFLFNGSVRENLALAKRGAEEGELWMALEAAHAADFVRSLPQGLDSHIGERGVKLSGGERQRLSIARALLKNAPLLLLDEATASVDSETERLIQDALDRLMRNRTAVVIAHRLSTIRNADRIYVLDHGRIVEEGSHDELLAAAGKYAKLSRKSFLAENTAD